MRKSIFLGFLLLVLNSHQLYPQNFFQKLWPIPYTQNEKKTVTLSFVGDLMCHSPQFNYAQVGPDSFDFNPVYREVKEYLEDSDFTIGNLETVIGDNNDKYTGYPRFNSPRQYVDALKQNGFDLLLTANNHTMDQGSRGVLRTLNTLVENGLNYTGSFQSPEDRDSVRIYDINGIKFSILAYSYGTNGITVPENKKYLINLIDSSLIKQDVISGKRKGAEITIVYFHFGEEYKREPSAFQKSIVQSAIRSGADVIIGSHPHVIQPTKYYNSDKSVFDSVFVAYSLGNFISNQRKRFTDAGVILTLEISKNVTDNTFNLEEIYYLPTWIFKGNINGKNEFLILPSFTDSIESDYQFLNEWDLQKLIEASTDPDEILSKYGVHLKRLKKDGQVVKSIY